MRTSSYEGFYRAGLYAGGFLPLAVIVLMTLNGELPWRFGLLGHLLAGCLLGALGATAEMRVIRRGAGRAWATANTIGSVSFVGIVILGTIVAQQRYGAGELFCWFFGWGMVRLALVRRAIGPFVAGG
jgi:hypothetical protein